MIGLLGASGYVGSEFKKQLILRDLEFVELSRETHDYYHIPNLITALEATNVDLLINCAGYTGKPNVDAVEDNKDVAYKANVDLARNIANVCYLGQIKLVHISSGCIYEGDNDRAVAHVIKIAIFDKRRQNNDNVILNKCMYKYGLSNACGGAQKQFALASKPPFQIVHINCLPPKGNSINFSRSTVNVTAQDQNIRFNVRDRKYLSMVFY